MSYTQLGLDERNQNLDRLIHGWRIARIAKEADSRYWFGHWEGDTAVGEG